MQKIECSMLSKMVLSTISPPVVHPLALCLNGNYKVIYGQVTRVQQDHDKVKHSIAPGRGLDI